MNKEELFQVFIQLLYATYKSKNADYGDSFGISYSKFGDMSALVRISDKYNRLESLLSGKDILVKDESIDDTIKDLANYCIMWLIERRIKENDES